MGEVYRARDPRLKREVAIKVSSAQFSERFEREAQAIAALNHSNTCQIYDVGPNYLVMELIEGAPLKGPLPLDQALKYALQICDALDAAHQKGITHRDLKPANILVTKAGIKLLDFGLAKLSTAAQSEATLTMALTGKSEIVGTLYYMSPEQLQAQATGQEIDGRSDIFSFGLVLYEMLTGKRAMEGLSPASVIAAIMERPAPSIADLAPAALDRVLKRCLEKDPDERWQSARDLKYNLELAMETTVVAAPTRARTPWSFVASAVAGLAAVAARAFSFLRSAHSDPPSFQSLTFRREVISNARFAPDGKTVVYDSTEDGVNYHIYSVQPGNPERRDLGIDAKLLDVSGTGQMALLNASGELQSAPVGGGAPRTVAEGVNGASWAPDGKELAMVRTIDGHDRLEYPPGKVLYQSHGKIGDLRISRDGQAVYLEDHPLGGDSAGFVRMIDSASKAKTLSPLDGILGGLSLPKDADGVLYAAAPEGLQFSLYAASREGRVRRIAGFPEWYVQHAVNAAGEVLLKRELFRDLMFVSESPSAPPKDLSWHDDSISMDFSMDGKSVLFLEGGAASGIDYEVYLRGTDGSPAIHLGFGAATSLSADGRWALVTKNQLPAQLFLLPTGAGQARQVTADSLHHEDAAFLPDGQSIVFVGNAPGRPRMWYAQDLKGGPPRAFGPEGVSFSHLYDPVVVSPDGRNVAVVTTDKNVLLQPIDGGAGQAIPGLEAGFTPVRWCPGGAAIMLQKQDGVATQIFETNVTTGAQRLWKSIAPPEALGVARVRSVRVAPDCRSVAWTVLTQETRLFLMKGLRY